ncbi:MAG: gamma-glutamyl-gamma-aminobutyrate hydrolase family protein [Pseudomonadota bacterium]
MRRLDGLVLTGGSDIDPTAYGSSDKPWSPPDVERDRFELAALEVAEERGLVVLGICRGSQLLNVHRGGDLHDDIQPLRKASKNYRTLLPRRPVQIEEQSRLNGVFGRDRFKINALHHQAVDSLGHSLSVAAIDEDAVVQGIEDPAHTFCVGVQWHPEYLFWSPPHLNLFRALVEAAARHQRETRPVRR